MRPALIAVVAAVMPLGIYAHPGWSQSVKETVKTVSDKTDMTAAKETKAAPKTETATTPKRPAPPSSYPPSKVPPLCASAEVAIWNPAATGKGVICTPTSYAALERKTG